MSYGWQPLEPELPNCQWLTTGPDGDPGYQCGQQAGHGGEHCWWTPGQYALPPILHPLDELLMLSGLCAGVGHCPNGHGAGRRAHHSFTHGWRWLYREVSVDYELPPTVITDQWGEMWRPDYACEAVFRPCGCRFRIE